MGSTTYSPSSTDDEFDICVKLTPCFVVLHSRQPFPRPTLRTACSHPSCLAEPHPSFLDGITRLQCAVNRGCDINIRFA
ncbi:hypothetical protein IG631_10780 [Alternaria alternata]|nr:hypothetical protein IG631_10780 [Alternaria alternata]